MAEFNGKERRRTLRKKVYLPVKLFLDGDLIASGWGLDINCYGIKVGIELEANLKIMEDKNRCAQIFTIKKVIVEIGIEGCNYHIKVPAEVRWNTHPFGEGKEKTYEVGLNLQLNEEQQNRWLEFYNQVSV